MPELPAVAVECAADRLGFSYVSAGPDRDPFDFSARYMTPDGERIEIDETDSVFSVGRLAAGFTTAGLRAEVVPQPPWVGAVRQRPTPPVCDGTSSAVDIVERFDRAVEVAMGDADTVAVTVSGGMDSAAVLAASGRVCRRDGRRLFAISLDNPDDDGGRPAVMAAAIIDALGVEAPLLVVEPDAVRWPEPAWSRHGPRCDAEPRYRFGIAATAAQAGAHVLLHGTAADELLTSPSYLAGRLLRRAGGAAARSYLRGRGDSEAEQLMALACGRMRSARTARWYWALRWPSRAPGHGTATLTARARVAASAWAFAHREESIRIAVDQRATWAQAAALHMLFPRDLLLPASDLSERFPFLDPDFARYAYHIPLESRHSTKVDSAYQRNKGLVLDLLPQRLHRLMPASRLRGYTSYERYWDAMPGEAPISVELGLVEQDWSQRCVDAFDRAMVLSVETWLRGALEAGSAPVYDIGGRA